MLSSASRALSVRLALTRSREGLSPAAHSHFPHGCAVPANFPQEPEPENSWRCTKTQHRGRQGTKNTFLSLLQLALGIKREFVGKARENWA